jgi:hypothetical protein
MLFHVVAPSVYWLLGVFFGNSNLDAARDLWIFLDPSWFLHLHLKVWLSQ